jgi:hypothetical protein
MTRIGTGAKLQYRMLENHIGKSLANILMPSSSMADTVASRVVDVALSNQLHRVRYEDLHNINKY